MTKYDFNNIITIEQKIGVSVLNQCRNLKRIASGLRLFSITKYSDQPIQLRKAVAGRNLRKYGCILAVLSMFIAACSGSSTTSNSPIDTNVESTVSPDTNVESTENLDTNFESTENLNADVDSTVESFPDEAFPADGTSRFDVEWIPTTLVLEASEYQSALNQPLNSGGITLTFNLLSLPEGIDELRVGHHVVLSELGIYKVTNTSTTASDLLIELEPGSLPDAVVNANIGWNYELAGGQDVARVSPLTSGDETRLFSTSATGQFQGNIDGFYTDFGMDTSNNQWQFTLSVTTDTGGQVLVNGYMTGFRTRGAYIIENGEVKRFYYEISDIEASLTADFNADGNIAGSIEVPAVVYFPFLMGPIPAYLGIGTALTLESTLGESGSATVSANLEYNGGKLVMDMTRHATEGGINADGGINAGTISGASRLVTNLSAGAGVVIDYPRIELGIGVPSINVTAGLVTRMRFQAYSNVHSQLDNRGTLQCQAVGAGVYADVGGELTYFNFSYSKSAFIFSKQIPTKLQGNGCAACQTAGERPAWCEGIEGDNPANQFESYIGID